MVTIHNLGLPKYISLICWLGHLFLSDLTLTDNFFSLLTLLTPLWNVLKYHQNKFVRMEYYRLPYNELEKLLNIIAIYLIFCV